MLCSSAEREQYGRQGQELHRQLLRSAPGKHLSEFLCSVALSNNPQLQVTSCNQALNLARVVATAFCNGQARTKINAVGSHARFFVFGDLFGKRCALRSSNPALIVEAVGSLMATFEEASNIRKVVYSEVERNPSTTYIAILSVPFNSSSNAGFWRIFSVDFDVNGVSFDSRRSLTSWSISLAFAPCDSLLGEKNEHAADEKTLGFFLDEWKTLQIDDAELTDETTGSSSDELQPEDTANGGKKEAVLLSLMRELKQKNALLEEQLKAAVAINDSEVKRKVEDQLRDEKGKLYIDVANAQYERNAFEGLAQDCELKVAAALHEKNELQAHLGSTKAEVNAAQGTILVLEEQVAATKAEVVAEAAKGEKLLKKAVADGRRIDAAHRQTQELLAKSKAEKAALETSADGLKIEIERLKVELHTQAESAASAREVASLQIAKLLEPKPAASPRKASSSKKKAVVAKAVRRSSPMAARLFVAQLKLRVAATRMGAAVAANSELTSMLSSTGRAESLARADTREAREQLAIAKTVAAEAQSTAEAAKKEVGEATARAEAAEGKTKAAETAAEAAKAEAKAAAAASAAAEFPADAVASAYACISNLRAFVARARGEEVAEEPPLPLEVPAPLPPQQQAPMQSMQPMQPLVQMMQQMQNEYANDYTNECYFEQPQPLQPQPQPQHYHCDAYHHHNQVHNLPPPRNLPPRQQHFIRQQQQIVYVDG